MTGDPAIIPGLPEHLQLVPDDADSWRAWREQVDAYRQLVRRRCEEDPDARAVALALCEDDPAYFVTVFGAIFEPRRRGGRKPGWYPFIPYAFQVRLMRWIDDVLAIEGDDDERADLGRGDGVVEKSRDMAGTWTFLAVFAHHWLFWDAFTAGLMSYKEDLVDDTGNPRSMFFKVEGLLGIGRVANGIPPELRLPSWLQPAGFEPKLNDQDLKITHPTKPNAFLGESSTSKSGVGDRTTVRLNDEAAKFDDFGAAWSSQSATSDHRFALSSADMRFGPAFFNLARSAERAAAHPDEEGPSYLRLPWWVHPDHTEQWYARERARHKDDPHGFAREYDIDYRAGSGDWVYSYAQDVDPVAAPYDPRLGQLFCMIDPAVRDPTFVGWVQHDPGENRYRAVEAFVGPAGAPAEYIASILVGVPITGPEGFDYDQAAAEVMDWTAALRCTIVYVGDPYGDNQGGSGRESFYQALTRKSRELTDGRHVVLVGTKYDEGARYHPARKEATRDLLPRIDWNDTNRVRYWLEAVKNAKYKTEVEGRSYQSEPTEPLHDWTSHPTTALEYFAVHRRLAKIAGNLTRSKPQRTSLGGKVLVPGRNARTLTTWTRAAR